MTLATESPVRVILCLLPVAVLAHKRHHSSPEVDLLLMRHGQSVANVFPRQGIASVVDPQLTVQGRMQALDAGDMLATLPSPDLVFSSCMLRAEETALLAFSEQSVVYVAPYISETSWGEPLLKPSSTPSSREQQQKALQNDLGLEDAARLSYAWAPPQADCGPPNWNRFISWLWNQDEVRNLVVKRLAADERPRIAVVSHGDFLHSLFGWSQRYPNNAEVFAASLSINMSSDGHPQGFGSLSLHHIAFPGGSDNLLRDWTEFYIALILALVTVLALLKRKFLLRRRQEAVDDTNQGCVPPMYVRLA